MMGREADPLKKNSGKRPRTGKGSSLGKGPNTGKRPNSGKGPNPGKRLNSGPRPNSGKGPNAGKRKKKGQISIARALLLAEAVLIVIALIVLLCVEIRVKKGETASSRNVASIESDSERNGGESAEGKSSTDSNSGESTEGKSSKDGDKKKEKEPADGVDMAEAKEDKEPDFVPYCTEQTKPSNYIEYTEVNVDGTTLTSLSDYKPADVIDFSRGSAYTSVDGIVTFRGNNFRDNPVYGYAEMKDYAMEGAWSYNTGSLTYGDACWTGSGWTGQPLIAKWPEETRNIMNMYDWAKQQEELTEVIYACMDGYIYFLELETGKATRDPLYLGYTFKGAGALDPRGYPIMYVGAGYDSNNGTAKAFIINLLDCSVMHTFGDNDTFSLRGSLSYFDSSALVDAETDTLIYPGENGILYLMKLNTNYDETAGTLSVSPGNIVKWHYYGTRTSLQSYWLGMEDSAAVYKGYLFVADNGGNLMCLNLNTLELVWVQDVLDDSNSTPVLSVEDGHLYLYVSTSFHLGWRSYESAEVPIWKIDAENGEIVWKTSYECYTEDGVSGGVQSTVALGANELSDYVYVTVARTGAAYDGVLACIRKDTGKVEWEHTAYYAWSSPACVYNSDGSGAVLYCSCGGKMYLLNGKTGEAYDTFELSEGAIEASPAVYNDYVVVGTRDSKIWGVKLK
ncbi:MAG: PQQ-binding-like beta-propeller repeat protein [Eubacteriales bacterium]|nr:PQQ-binding-like beta-propeller repeat protein [Eubacteriales bacterium]